MHALIAATPFQPNRFLRSSETNLTGYTLNCIAETLSENSGIAFVKRVSDRIVGLITVSTLPWESRVLRRSVYAVKHLYVDDENTARGPQAEALVRTAGEWANKRAVDLLICKVYTDDMTAIPALENNGFRLMETGLNYVFDCKQALPAGRQCGEALVIRRADARDETALAVAARLAFSHHFGRFHSDPRIDPDEATAIYEEWIRSSCRGYADAVFLAERGGEIAGFSVWKNPSAVELSAGIRAAHYSIGAVVPQFQGKGLFQALTLEGMRMYHAGTSLIEGPTNLKNLGVQRGYQKLGWQLRDSYYSFHKWL
ncbi:MAG TPA: hypothetical protein VER58_00875 [Thermoanaerobaculia bacterium]|nr:hypothetical protein [Thermoanaerobaculia bacterium]